MAEQLDPPDALDIAIRCVKRVSGQDSEEGNLLEDVGIPDNDSIQELKDTIVHEDIGVSQDGYEMKTSDLNGMSPSWTVGGVGRRIRKKARPA
jgi:hypothetical protein